MNFSLLGSLNGTRDREMSEIVIGDVSIIFSYFVLIVSSALSRGIRVAYVSKLVLVYVYKPFISKAMRPSLDTMANILPPKIIF